MAVNNIYNSGIANNSNPHKTKIDAAKSQTLADNTVKSNVEGKDTIAKSRTDSVTLTEQAQSFSEIHKKAKNSPEISQEKIESIKKAIIDGTYEIDSVAIANKMVDFEQELDFLYN